MGAQVVPAYGSLGPVCDPDVVYAPKVTSDPDIVDKTTLTNYTDIDRFPKDAKSRKDLLDLLGVNPPIGYGYNSKGELTFVYNDTFTESAYIKKLKDDITNYVKSYPTTEQAGSYYAEPIVPGETIITAVPSGTFHL